MTAPATRLAALALALCEQACVHGDERSRERTLPKEILQEIGDAKSGAEGVGGAAELPKKWAKTRSRARPASRLSRIPLATAAAAPPVPAPRGWSGG